MVQRHDYVGAQVFLNFDDQLRREEMLGAVDQRPELDPVRTEAHYRAEAEDLVAAAVG